jgi:osmoprotectant transport system permease protein
VLPLLRNTVVGLASVEPSVVEAARGVGMAPAEQLRRVELPLALPVIIAGARTSTVWTVGMATLSTPVGAPSLGNFIFSGLQTRNYAAVLVGCVGAAALALVLDGVVRALGLGVERRRRPVVVSALVVLGLLYAYAAAGMVRHRMADGPRPVVIGAKTFTEQYVLSEIVAGQVARATGEPTRVVQSLGSSVVFDALRSKQIDLYVDYSGTIWANVMHRDTVPSRAEVLSGVGAFLRERYGIELVTALGFENAYALAMRRDRAQELGVRRIGDLVVHAPRMTIGGDYEFFGRPEWTRVRRTYHLAFSGERSMDPSLMYQAARERQVDIISAFSTDGRIVAFDLVVLEDDRQAIPPYDAILLASAKLVRERPELIKALRNLSGSIDADRMRRMNLAVDQAGRSPRTVAQEFLDGHKTQ